MKDYTPLSKDTCVPVDDDKPITVTESSVAQKLSQISISKTGGPDNLPNWVLKEYAYILAPAVTDIINTSFQECKVPSAWKMAGVPPIPKKRSIEDLNKDLRPLSLTSTLSKVAESYIIEKDLKPTLLKSMDPQQYGFIPRSCTTFALISMIHHWLKLTDGTGSTVRVSLLDYRKAFDLVDHNLLIAKLFSLGVKPTVVNWITDFLRERYQRVTISSESYSSLKLVPAGIPQGTKIGPWLFLAMINDLNISQPTMSMWKFADDTTVSEVIPKGDSSKLQETIHEIANWSRNNKFQLNPSKCKELIINFTKQSVIEDPIKMNDLPFETVSQAKILGVTITKDLKWNVHIEDIIQRASKRIYLLRQLKKADVESCSLVKFYCACIRSILEYSCQVFHTSLPQYLTEELERIQKRSLRIIFPDLSYKDAIGKANIGTLFDRRETLCEKLFSQIEVTNDNEKHKLWNLLPPRHTTSVYDLRQNRVYLLPKVKTNRYKNCFILHHAAKAF